MKLVCAIGFVLSLLAIPLHVALGNLAEKGKGIPGTPYESIVSASEFGHFVGPASVLGILFWGGLGLVFLLTGSRSRTP